MSEKGRPLTILTDYYSAITFANRPSMSGNRPSIARRFVEWFTAPDTPVPIAWVRMAVASFCLLHVWICPLWLALAAGMHLAIGVFLGMWMFALIMIILNLGAFGYDVVMNSSGRGRRIFPFQQGSFCNEIETCAR